MIVLDKKEGVKVIDKDTFLIVKDSY